MDPRNKIAVLEAEIVRLTAQVEVLSRDCVSGLLTRHEFENTLERVFKPRRAGDQPFGVVMVDIDHFKLVNDRHGHRTGDEAIFQVAQCIQRFTRGSDTVARYGGEEFVAIVACANTEGLSILAERVRGAIEHLEIMGCHSLTVSVGYTVQTESDKSGWDVVERADAALLRAKQAGRNRVEEG